jgi:hypothetical protein
MTDPRCTGRYVEHRRYTPLAPEMSPTVVGPSERFNSHRSPSSRRDHLHAWFLRIVVTSTATTSLALTCRWRSRPQHQILTSCPVQSTPLLAPVPMQR